MNQTWLLPVRATQGLQHAVDMAIGAGPSLNGETEWLVQHQHVAVFEEGHVLERAGILVVGAGAPHRRGGKFLALGRTSGAGSTGGWHLAARDGLLRFQMVRSGKLRLLLQRRDADGLTGGEPGIGFHPPAFDPHLPTAQQLLQMAEGKVGIMGLEPAVEPHALFIRVDAACLNGHDVGTPYPCT